MEYLPLTDQDEELIQAATDVIRRNFVLGKHHVGAAMRCTSGKIYTGVHLESRAHDICAEAVTIGTAVSAGERQFDAIVAVTVKDGDPPVVLSPCGGCRELIRFYGDDIAVLFIQDGQLRKARAADLLPGPYLDPKDRKRQGGEPPPACDAKLP